MITSGHRILTTGRIAGGFFIGGKFNETYSAASAAGQIATLVDSMPGIPDVISSEVLLPTGDMYPI